MKKFIVGLLIAALAFSLAACSSQSSGSSKSAKSASTALDQIKKKGVLTVGTEGTYAPYTYHDSKTNKLVGFDVDVIRAVGQRLGVKVQFEESAWDSLFAGLNAKRFDTIANDVAVTPDRQKKYDFSSVYSTSQSVIVTRKDNNKIKTLNDLKGVKVAQGLTSNFGEETKKAGAVIIGEDDLSKALKLVSQSRADALVNDQGAVLQYFNTVKDNNLKIAAVVPTDSANVAFPVLKGNGLDKAFTKELQALKKDGTLKKISEKYFGKDISK
ncbi:MULTISPECIES: transporter substrate-binding domain-containing protein [unclassified Sporolactobacillus]|uniref:transporter substrate-binding domain-containing protein n=1 Tax=unclassified Sporolactobacillus TaxID=2628533 RepID=UPI0023677E6E|nr:transporter substrate-binding domain-containing protein [Sporolactobacillus sp. CQH2019]MDD9148417.1 transporter substrate-binding domain-containing protein [Sporolactobacillus sp. CQH2019]